MRRNQQDSAGETFRPRFELIKFCQSNREAWKKGYSLQESFVKQKWPNFYPTVYSTICCILRAALAQNLWWMRDTLEMEAIVWTTLCRAGQGCCPCITVAHPSDVQSCLTLSDSTDCSPLGFRKSMGIFEARILKEMECHFLLQGIFPTQGSNLSLLCLLHRRRIL